MEFTCRLEMGGCRRHALSQGPVGGHEHDEGEVDEDEDEPKHEVGPDGADAEEEGHNGHAHVEKGWEVVSRRLKEKEGKEKKKTYQRSRQTHPGLHWLPCNSSTHRRPA